MEIGQKTCIQAISPKVSSQLVYKIKLCILTIAFVSINIFGTYIWHIFRFRHSNLLLISGLNGYEGRGIGEMGLCKRIVNLIGDRRDGLVQRDIEGNPVQSF
jgi:hypothetical protein